MKIFLDVIGCRLNQSEVEGFANTFRALGHQIVADPEEADLAIVNTCAVTVKAAADSRKQLRKAAREGAKQVVATGCWATLYPQQALDLAGVTDVVHNQNKESLISRIFDLKQEDISQLTLVREPLPGDRARTRAFIKVQEGCDNHCTYCLTRLARGKSRSRNLDAIRTDIQAALAGDAKEIVLTGVQLGAWGRDLAGPMGMKDLLYAALAISGVERIRLSSIEPWDFDPQWLEYWQDERLCRHLHIPLQSGTDRVLKLMGRLITRDAYVELIATIRRAVPEIAITTDIIAGFPGETEAEFSESKKFIQSMRFAGGHVFTFSPRPGTAAIKMEGRVPVPAVKARNAELRKIFLAAGQNYREQFIGRQMPVLWESGGQTSDGIWQISGLTDNYIRIYADSQSNLWNQITQANLVRHHPSRAALIGEVDPSDQINNQG